MPLNPLSQNWPRHRGIETRQRRGSYIHQVSGRRVGPDIEGIETRSRRFDHNPACTVAEMAPTARGLKLVIWPGEHLHEPALVAEMAPSSRGLKPAAATDLAWHASCRRDGPNIEGIETTIRPTGTWRRTRHEIAEMAPTSRGLKHDGIGIHVVHMVPSWSPRWPRHRGD